MKLGKCIAAYRAQHGISIRKLAKQVGVETTALFRFERGRSIANDKWVKVVRWAFSN
jgi:transcriptional regulator with XRE-family HTH domain